MQGFKGDMLEETNRMVTNDVQYTDSVLYESLQKELVEYKRRRATVTEIKKVEEWGLEASVCSNNICESSVSFFCEQSLSVEVVHIDLKNNNIVCLISY